MGMYFQTVSCYGEQIMQTFSIYALPPTLNELNNMHHFKRAKKKEQWEQLTLDACMEYRIQPVERVSITMELYFPDRRRRDLDNYSGLGFKFIGDGLVKAGIIKDDSIKEVIELRIRYGGISKPPHILIHLGSV